MNISNQPPENLFVDIEKELSKTSNRYKNIHLLREEGRTALRITVTTTLRGRKTAEINVHNETVEKAIQPLRGTLIRKTATTESIAWNIISDWVRASALLVRIGVFEAEQPFEAFYLPKQSWKQELLLRKQKTQEPQKPDTPT